MWNIFKIDNKDIKKEHDQDMFIVHQKNTSKKSSRCDNLLIKKGSLYC